jgi:hypothetical protein
MSHNLDDLEAAAVEAAEALIADAAAPLAPSKIP